MIIHILLVDDDEDEHLFFRWSLEKIDTEISVLDAYNGPQAEEMLMKVSPELIFLDINLPGADGFECLEIIKNIPHIKSVPIYMYSTEITDKTIKRATKLGAAGCLKKSRSHDVLGRNIMEIMKTSSLEAVNSEWAIGFRQ